MKNLKITLVVLSILTCAQIIGMVEPAERSKAEIKNELKRKELSFMQQRIAGLPADIKKDILNTYFYRAFPNIPLMAAQMRAFANHLDATSIIKLFDALPYSVNALDLADQLKDLQLMKDAKIINWIKNARNSLIPFSAYDKTLDTIKQLLQNKNIDLYDEFYEPMNFAIKENLDVLELLLKAGVNPNKDHSFFRFIYSKATQIPLPALQKIITLFLGAGADPNLPSNFIENETPFLAAIDKNLPEKIITMLLNGGADPYFKGSFGSSLGYAIALKNPEMVIFLLDAGIDPRINVISDLSALDYAKRVFKRATENTKNQESINKTQEIIKILENALPQSAQKPYRK